MCFERAIKTIQWHPLIVRFRLWEPLDPFCSSFPLRKTGVSITENVISNKKNAANSNPTTPGNRTFPQRCCLQIIRLKPNRTWHKGPVCQQIRMPPQSAAGPREPYCCAMTSQALSLVTYIHYKKSRGSQRAGGCSCARCGATRLFRYKPSLIMLGWWWGWWCEYQLMVVRQRAKCQVEMKSDPTQAPGAAGATGGAFLTGSSRVPVSQFLRFFSRVGNSTFHSFIRSLAHSRWLVGKCNTDRSLNVSLLKELGAVAFFCASLKSMLNVTFTFRFTAQVWALVCGFVCSFRWAADEWMGRVSVCRTCVEWMEYGLLLKGAAFCLKLY